MNTKKYPRTFHLPNSLGVTSDDKIGDVNNLLGKEVVVLEKLDGECTAIYPNGQYHARSEDGYGYPWQSAMINEVLPLLYNEHGCILSDSQRMYGENMYAKHSIEYKDLRSWFYVFSLFDGDICLPWDDVEALPFEKPTVFYRGPFDSKVLEELNKTLDFTKVEGYVVRLTSAFHIDEFSSSVLKYVRSGHVTTDSHWRETWTPNSKR